MNGLRISGKVRSLFLLMPDLVHGAVLSLMQIFAVSRPCHVAPIKILEEMGLEILILPDLVSRDFHLFGPLLLCELMGGRRFEHFELLPWHLPSFFPKF